MLPAEKLEGLPPATASRFISLKCDLPAYNLNYLGDRQEMANSIEGRLPFLDNELADYAFQLPPSALHTVKEGKLPLRGAMANRLPNYVHQGRQAGLLGAGQRGGHIDAEQFLRGGAKPGLGARRWRV